MPVTGHSKAKGISTLQHKVEAVLHDTYQRAALTSALSRDSRIPRQQQSAQTPADSQTACEGAAYGPLPEGATAPACPTAAAAHCSNKATGLARVKACNKATLLITKSMVPTGSTCLGDSVLSRVVLYNWIAMTDIADQISQTSNRAIKKLGCMQRCHTRLL